MKTICPKVIGLICISILFFYNVSYADWTWPTENSELVNDHGQFTSEFGPNAYSDTEYRFHDGIDIDTYNAQDVYAAHSGTVTKENDGSYGLTIRIANSDGSRTRYCHMNSASVSTGDYVNQGDVIGKSGETPRGTHLHFERWEDGDDWENGKKRHPLKYMNYSSDDIDISYDDLGNDSFKIGITTPTNRLHVDKVVIIFTTGKSVENISIPYSPPDPAVIPFYLNPTTNNVFIDFSSSNSNWCCTYYVEPDYWDYNYRPPEDYTIYYRVN